MAALLSFLMIGGKLVMFLPVAGEDNTYDKLIYHIFNLYGIHIGSMDTKDPNAKMCWYDMNHLPQWLDLVYTYTNQISPYEYLIKYPYNLPICDRIMMRLLNDLRPYGVSLNEKIDVIKSLRKQLQINRNIRLPVESVVI